MKKIDKTVIRETLYVAAGSAVLSIVLHAVFLIIGKWNMTVLFGNLLGAGATVLNFFLMGLTVQSSVGRDEKEIKNRVRLSFILRELMLFGLVALGVLLPSAFNTVALIVSVFFPRITIFFRSRIKLPGDDLPQGATDVDEKEE